MSRSTIVLALMTAGSFALGVDAYRSGQFDAARDLFRAAIAEAGDDAPAELHYDLALAALRAGALTEAETAAAEAERSDPERFGALAEFLRGNVAFARCEQAAAQAEGPEAEAFAFDAAIALATKAKEAWRRAGATRAAWPEASRNVERAARVLDALARKRAEAEAKRRDPRREPAPKPPEPRADERRPALDETAGVESLPRERVRALLEVVAEQEKRKRALRQAVRVARGTLVERDW